MSSTIQPKVPVFVLADSFTGFVSYYQCKKPLNYEEIGRWLAREVGEATIFAHNRGVEPGLSITATRVLPDELRILKVEEVICHGRDQLAADDGSN